MSFTRVFKGDPNANMSFPHLPKPDEKTGEVLISDEALESLANYGIHDEKSFDAQLGAFFEKPKHIKKSAKED